MLYLVGGLVASFLFHHPGGLPHISQGDGSTVSCSVVSPAISLGISPVTGPPRCEELLAPATLGGEEGPQVWQEVT